MEAVTFPLPGDCSRRQRLFSGNQRVQGRLRLFFSLLNFLQETTIFSQIPFFPKSSAWAAYNLCPQHWCRKMCLHITPQIHTHIPKRTSFGESWWYPSAQGQSQLEVTQRQPPLARWERMVGFQKAQRTLQFCDGSTPGTLSLEGSHSCGLTTQEVLKMQLPYLALHYGRVDSYNVDRITTHIGSMECRGPDPQPSPQQKASLLLKGPLFPISLFHKNNSGFRAEQK